MTRLCYGIWVVRGTVALVLLGACDPSSKPVMGETTRDSIPSSTFKWVPIKDATGAAPEEYPARVLNSAGTTAVTVPALPARILAILAKPGDTVEKDGPIARVVMPDADAAVATASAAETSLRVLSRRRAQLGSLEAEGLAKASDLAALDLDIARLKGEKIRAEAILRSAGLSASAGSITLRSPLAGIVTEVAATQGELRRPEDGPIARVRSRGGERIEATLSARPPPDGLYHFVVGGEPPSLVRLVSTVPNASGVGYVAWFDASPGAPFPAVSEGRLTVGSTPRPDTHVVPSSAVGSQAQERFVVVRQRAAAVGAVVRVELIRVTSSDAIVKGQLPAGALVATDPYQARAAVEGDKQP